MENNKQLKVSKSAYHDYADATEENAISMSKRKEKTFPVRLHCLLSEVERLGIDWIVGWCPHGRSFVVKDQITFERDILPIWFRQTKIASFQRQLNIYGFRRLSIGVDKGAYYHEKFLRGKYFLALSIPRCRAQEAGRRVVAADFEPDPNFYAMKHLPVSQIMRPSVDFDGIPVRDSATANSNAQSLHTFLQPHESPTARLQHTHLATHLASNLAINRAALGLPVHSLHAEANSLIESIFRPIQQLVPSSYSPPSLPPQSASLPTVLGSSIHPFGITQNQANESLSLSRQMHPNNQFPSPLLRLLSGQDTTEQEPRYQEPSSANLLNFLAERLREPKSNSDTPAPSFPR